jgi:oligoribonuclease NrnB/cAMP/cGMP phosphodiesterase (DHH superfamily)
MRPICFFHAGCPDGFGAAWAVWRAWGRRGRYIPRGHDDALDARDYEGAHIVFVDIAPNNETLRDLVNVADRVVVLDHHVTSRDRYAADPSLENLVTANGHHVIFDLDHSGAVLAWRHFHPDEPEPTLLGYVEDQDLWSWKLARSEEINAAIGSHPREFDVWEELVARPIEELADEGVPLVRAQRTEVEHAVRSAHPVRVGNARAEAVNARHHRSAIGHKLAKRAAFGPRWGLVYRMAGGRVDVSIYSVGELDVSRVASDFGGGGHRNAAGFNLPLEDWLKRFI